MTMLLLAVMGSVWAVEVTTTYIFTDREWTATCNGEEANWNRGQRANGYTTGQGIQITAASTGAYATSPVPFWKVKKIVVTYCTNSRAGKGTIKLTVGPGAEQTFSVTAPSSGGTSLKTTEFTYDPNETGSVTLTVDCTTNSIYIYSIAITSETTESSTYNVTYNANDGIGNVPVDNGIYEEGDQFTVLGADNLTKDHYTFGGWNTADDGSGDSYTVGENYTISRSITLYAQWNPNTNTVTLPQDDTYGTYSMNKDNPVAYGENVELTYTPATGYENYVATWSVNGEEINGNSFVMPDDPVTVTVSLIEVTLDSWVIDFESATSAYSNWTFSSISSNESPNSDCTAHGGLKIGKIGATSGSIQTNEKIAKPVSLTCYVSKQTTNTSASTWYIQVSSNGSDWINVANISGASMRQGEWKELTASLSSYSDVYVRVYYTGSVAVRLIDDLTLTFDKASVPTHELSFYSNGELLSTETKGEGEIITFPSNLENEGDYVFVGWTTSEIDGKTDERPELLNTSSTTMAKNDMDIYAVFANISGEGAKWKKVESKNVGAGVYAIVNTKSDKPFNGSLSNGDALLTTDAFVFESDGYAYNTPAGTCELTLSLSQAGSGYTMYNADNGYLCVKESTSRHHISWQESDDSYWSYSSNNWGYLVTDLAEPATSVLQCYEGNDIRNYAASSTYTPVYFAQKEAAPAYSNYCTLINFEKVTLSTDGYITYVTKNAIDWEQTLARNSQDGVDVHGYKVVDFGLDNGVSMVEYGLENLSTVTSTDKMYQEPIIPAGTPIIIQGKQGANYMVVSDEENVAAPAGNLLLASDGNATTTDDVKLFVLQKIDQNGSGIDNYAFYKLTKGRTIPEGKAYLSSDNVTLPDPETPGFDPNNVRTANPIRVLVQTNNDSLVSDDAGIIDGIGTVAQDSEDGQVIYNLNGVRVNNPSKGIYVKNEKKVIIK